MENNQLNQPSLSQANPYADDEIDLQELFRILWAEKWLIIGVTAFFAIGSVFYALIQSDIYRAEAVLASAESAQNPSRLAAQLGGAAALLGVNVVGGGGADISTAIATLWSRQFIVRFVRENERLIPLFAGVWDRSTGAGSINQEIYNEANSTWVSGGSPSDQDIYRAFSGIISVGGPDRTTGIITISVDWHNPVEAANWVNKLVASINREIKAQDVNRANLAISHLSDQLEQTQLVDMQREFYQLIESQTRITMLADVRDDYVFRVIDPAMVPDRKVEPRRSEIVLSGTFGGALSAIMLVYFRRLLKLKSTFSIK